MIEGYTIRIVTVLSDLVAQLLTEPDDALVKWKDKLIVALDGNGQLVIDAIPEVRHIIGPQPPIPELDIAESRKRFKRVLRNFIRVFCQAEYPLVIFVDDLQWVDPASLARHRRRYPTRRTKHALPRRGEQIIRETDRRRRDREAIITALEKATGKVGGQGGAAEILGVKPTTLHSRIKALGIKKPHSS